MLHRRQDNLIAGAEKLPAVGCRDEIDPFGGAAREDDLVILRGVDEAGDLVPRLLVRQRRLLAQRVDPAMDVGVFGLVVMPDRVDDDCGFCVVAALSK